MQPALESGSQGAAPPIEKTRPRRNGNQFVLAARRRRQQQEDKNFRHPPSGDEIWICEFCEYESIFGVPPRALVEQYEIKDMKERRRLAEKRRLLEKAKMKGRKGKKASKAAAAKNSAAALAANQAHSHSTQTMPTDQMQSQGTQSDGYIRDEFFDGEDVPIAAPTPPPPPPPPPTLTPTIHTAVTAASVGHGRNGLGPGVGSSKLGPGGGGGGGEAVRAN